MEIEAARTRLRSILTGPVGGHSAQQAIREIGEPDAGSFFAIGCSILETLPESLFRPKAFARLFDCEIFLIELTRIGRLGDRELYRRCAAWMEVDRFLDLRLARLLPRRDDDGIELEAEQTARILDVLHHISTGPRLILLVNYLKHHPVRLVAEKATLLVARRIRNLGWVRQRLASTDARVRAAAVEGLWGCDTPQARTLLHQSRRDESSRVVANALLGLHLIGETGMVEAVTKMARDERPSFRRSACWVAGQMGDPQFADVLHDALADPVSEVRLGAKQALAAIRRAMPHDEPVVNAPVVIEAEVVQAPVPDPFRFKFDGTFNRGRG